jgi:hypothetical protein
MLAGFKQDNLRFAYSYDLTVSRLKNSTYGAHEVSVAFTFTCPEKKTRPGVPRCPSF